MEKGNRLTKQAFKEYNDRQFVDAKVCGMVVRLRSITIGEYFEGQHWANLENKRRKDEDETPVSFDIIPAVQMLCDENDKPMFVNLKAGYEVLTSKSKHFVQALMDEADKLIAKKIKLGNEPEEAIEELAKNSETPPDTTSSDLPSASAE